MKKETDKPEASYVEKWWCGRCYTLHDDRYEARECCRPDVAVLLVCSTCDAKFSEGDDKRAAACHPLIFARPRCLCGNSVTPLDKAPSATLGVLVWCAECREQILAGVPSPVAKDRTFARMAGQA